MITLVKRDVGAAIPCFDVTAVGILEGVAIGSIQVVEGAYRFYPSAEIVHKLNELNKELDDVAKAVA